MGVSNHNHNGDELIWRRIRTLLFALIFLFNYENQVLRNFGTPDHTNHTKLLNNSSGGNTTTVSATIARPIASMWDDLDLSSTISCGHHRCFIPSVTDGNAYGYLVSNVETESTLEGMLNETELAFKMQTQYKAKTFHIENERPQSVSMPDELRMKMNAQVRNPLREHQFPDSLGENNTIDSFYTKSSVIVQKMKAAYKSSLLAHCADNGFTKPQLPNFISNIMDEVEFGANIARDRYRMYNMLIEMPQLATDLQILINNRGEVYFIDFGGHGSWKERDKVS